MILRLETVWLAPMAAVAVAFTAAALRYAWRSYRVFRSLYPGPSRGYALLQAARLAAVALLAAASLSPVLVVKQRIPVEGPGDIYTSHPRLQLVLLVDVSKSMLREGRGEAAARAVEALLARLPASVHVAVYPFSATIQPPVCKGPPAGCANVSGRLLSLMGQRYTAIGSALAAAVSAARAAGEPVAVVVVTDGANNYGAPLGSAFAAAKAAKVPVAVLLVGGDPRASRLVEEAAKAGVRVYPARSVDEAVALLLRAAGEAGYEALRARGRLYVEAERLYDTPATLLAAGAAVLLALWRLDGL